MLFKISLKHWIYIRWRLRLKNPPCMNTKKHQNDYLDRRRHTKQYWATVDTNLLGFHHCVFRGSNPSLPTPTVPSLNNHCHILRRKYEYLITQTFLRDIKTGRQTTWKTVSLPSKESVHQRERERVKRHSRIQFCRAPWPATSISIPTWRHSNCLSLQQIDFHVGGIWRRIH